MFHIALHQPEIPPNTGNIIRLCANTGASLHLIHPLGFVLDDKKLQRAGLDYHEWVSTQQHQNFAEFQQKANYSRLFAVSTKGQQYYHQVQYQANDGFLFGAETSGLPAEILEPLEVIRVPMLANQRSLNLSNTVAIVLYEALRQQQFENLI